MLVRDSSCIHFFSRVDLEQRSTETVLDICFSYNLNVDDKQLIDDLTRLCHYAILSNAISLITKDEKCVVVFVDTGLKTGNSRIEKLIRKSYACVSKMLKHRFIRCSGCTLPKTPVFFNDVNGELKETLLIATQTARSDIRHVKQFVSKNRLNEIQNRFDQSVSLMKVLLFL